MTIRIPDGNTFRIRLTARNLITGEYTEAADLHSINNLVINYVRRGVRFAQTFTIDDEGRAIIVNQGTLDCGLYGIELTGYYGGEPFRFYGKDMFEITDDTVDVSDPSDPSDIIDIEITIKLNTSGVSKAYVDYAIENVNRDMAAMGDALRDEISEAGQVDDVKVNGVSVVSQKEANVTVPTKVSDLQNDSEFTNKSYVDAGISGKQDVINDLAAIRSGATAGSTAYQKPASGIPSSDLSAEVQDMIENGGKTKSVSVNGGTPVTPDANGQVDLTIEQANVTIGTVSTGPAGSDAEVNNSGTGTAPVLDFVIPKGDKGETGPQGPQGDSAVYNPDDPDTPDFVMANTTGQSTTKSMTQKAVTEAVEGSRSYSTDLIDVSPYFVENYYIRYDNGNWRYYTGGGGYGCVIVPVTPGEIYKITGRSMNAAYLETNTHPKDTRPSYAAGTTDKFSWDENEEKEIPNGVNYLYLFTKEAGEDFVFELHRIMTVRVKIREMDGALTEAEQVIYSNDIVDEEQYYVANRYIRHDQQVWYSLSGQGCVLIPVKENEVYVLSVGNLFAAYLSTNTYTGTPSFAGGTSAEFTWAEGEQREIPQGVNYLYLLVKNGGTEIEHELRRNYNVKKKLEDAIANVEESFAECLKAKDNSNADLTIEDDNGNAVVVFKNGHIITGKFNSETDISTKKSDYDGMVFSVLGDSMSTFGVPNQSNATGTWTWPGNRCRYPQNNLFTNVKYQWWYLLMERLGMTLGINESWAGSRVSNTQAIDDGDLGPNRCISSQTRIDHLRANGEPDIILVEAGGNDLGANVSVGTFNTANPIGYTEEQIAELPMATFADAYRTMLIRLQYYYRYSRIICIFPWFTTDYWTIAEADKFIEVMREACDFFGVEYVDLRQCGITIYNRANYLPDGIHPNAGGMEFICNHIIRTVFK
ncbi:MAG: hypothetical protein IJK08_04025 [Prevotella sp.]|nr:hypothetical protein [Prevotella sp.]